MLLGTCHNMRYTRSQTQSVSIVEKQVGINALVGLLGKEFLDASPRLTSVPRRVAYLEQGVANEKYTRAQPIDLLCEA